VGPPASSGRAVPVRPVCRARLCGRVCFRSSGHSDRADRGRHRQDVCHRRWRGR
jgi:hypothetical protein